MATNNGLSGDDNIVGSSGADSLNGGAGSDTLDGGAGSDRLNAGAGDDVLVYSLGENLGASDVYTGGSGIDTLKLNLTRDQWLDDTVQTQLARYFAHLSTVQTNGHGEVSNGSSRDFTFNFGSSTTLTVQMIEKLEVFVDGEKVADLDAPTIDVAHSALDGSVAEDVAPGPATGTIKFFDLDVTDTHTVTVTPPAGALFGTFTASVTEAATGDGKGSVSWKYEFDNAAAQSLGVGDTRTESYAVTIVDDEGRVVTQAVTVTITGTNDVPVAVAAAAAVSEDATINGNVGATDVDAGETATLTYALADASAAPAGLTFNSDGSYSFDASSYDYLNAGEPLVLTIPFTATDENGATSAGANLVITVTGTNDTPVITSAVQAGEVQEDVLPTATGQVTSSDVDNGATATYSGDAAGTYGSFAVDSATGEWTYTLDNAAHQDLSAGELHTESFTVTVTDEHGASTSQDVVISIRGTNDAPVVSGVVLSTIGEDDAGPATLNLLANASDIDSVDLDVDSVGYTVSAGAWASPVAFTVDAETGMLSLDPAQFGALGAGANVELTFNYNVVDGDGGVTPTSAVVTIVGSDDGSAPTDIQLVVTSQNVNQNNFNFTLNGSLSATDADSGDFAYAFVRSDGTVGTNLTSNGTTFNISGNSLTSATNLGNGADHELTIRVTQAGDPDGLHYDETFRIQTGATNNSADALAVGGPLPTDDVLFGGNGIDVLLGDGGNDNLFGGAMGDQLLGDGGDDVLHGGTGQDFLTGGAGSDRFVFDSAGTSDGDRVFDFLSADDVLDLNQSVFQLANGWSGGTVDSVVHVTSNGAAGTTIAGADLVVWDAGSVASKDTVNEIDTLLRNQGGTFEGGVLVLAQSNSASGSPAALYYDSDANSAGGLTLIAVFSNHATLSSLGLPTLASDYVSH
jgi:VCBS repeat-containing protein